jgi:hypothetical protein
MTNLFDDTTVAQDPDTRLRAAYVEDLLLRPPVKSCRVENVHDAAEVKEARRCAAQYAQRDISRTFRALVAAEISDAEMLTMLEAARRGQKGK